MSRTAVVALAVALICGGVAAAERQVVVNGVLLDPAQLAELDALAGVPVQDGAYWLDLRTGIWGYADDPTARGRIGPPQGEYAHPDGNLSGNSAEGDETDWSGFRMPE